MKSRTKEIILFEYLIIAVPSCEHQLAFEHLIHLYMSTMK